jgi:hypothetical protein
VRAVEDPFCLEFSAGSNPPRSQLGMHVANGSVRRPEVGLRISRSELGISLAVTDPIQGLLVEHAMLAAVSMAVKRGLEHRVRPFDIVLRRTDVQKQEDPC